MNFDKPYYTKRVQEFVGKISRINETYTQEQIKEINRELLEWIVNEATEEEQEEFRDSGYGEMLGIILGE